MLEQLAIGGLLIITTFIFQAFAFDLIIKRVLWMEKKTLRRFKNIWKSLVFVVIISSISIVLIIDIWLWGAFYLYADILPDLESALYFSATTFTTVGYGDVFLDKSWRLLSSIESMNGFLLFGWATAFLWEMITRIYHKEGKALERR